MKKLLIISLVSLISMTISCNMKKPLYINTTSIVEESGKKNRTETISKVKSDYFEIGLYSMQRGTGYKAEMHLERNMSNEHFKLVFITIVSENGELLSFNNSMEFLNFMSERGYEMVDKKEERFVTFFTFKKK